MARPEQVPVAAATDEFGEAAELTRLAAAAPLGEEPPAAPLATGAAPRVPPPVEGIEAPEEDLVIPEDDEFEDDLAPEAGEEFLFGESLRQEEPLTAGAPIGAGPSFIRAPQENDDAFLLRIAKTLAASGDRDGKRFADRIATDKLGLRRLS